MRRLTSIVALAVLAWAPVCAFPQQGSEAQTGNTAAAAPQNPSAETVAGADGTEANTTPAKDSKADDSGKPGTIKRLKRHLRDQVSGGCVNAVGTHCWDKPLAEDQNSDKKDQTQQSAANNPPPRSDQGTGSGESSSRGTKIDLSPPAGEAPAPGVGVDPAEADVREFKPWDPHKADKNVEIGDFYFKRGNYRAAQSRYKEALYWKDNDAIAMFRLGQAEEKLGQFSDARKNYGGYLKILPEGEFSEEANKALERLKDKSDRPVAAVRR